MSNAKEINSFSHFFPLAGPYSTELIWLQTTYAADSIRGFWNPPRETDLVDKHGSC